MQRGVAVSVIALVSSSIACGGFLGFGDDDELPPAPSPSSDGGPDVTVAEGGSTADASEVCETRTMVLDTDAFVAGPDWSKGTLIGGGELTVANGALVSRLPIDGAPKAEATIFATREGNVSRITCTARVSTSSFADEGRFIELRIEGPRWVDFYGIRVDWADGTLRAARQATPVGGAELAEYAPVPTPAVDTFHDLRAELVLGPTPKFEMSIAGASQSFAPPAAGTVTRAQVAVGTLASGTFVPYEVRYASVDCEMCVVP